MSRWKSRVRLADEVANELRRRIYSAEIQFGELLRQESLASDLEVSRTPLREALRTLQDEGLVVADSPPSTGLRVVPRDPQHLLEAFLMREVVDGLAARIAAQGKDPDLQTDLEVIMSRLANALKPWRPEQWSSANVSFHGRLLQASSNKYLIRQLPLIQLTSHVFAPVGQLTHDRATGAYQEHQTIVNAICARDEVAAEALARAHVRTTIDVLVREINES